jgi:hypothetical protein
MQPASRALTLFALAILASGLPLPNASAAPTPVPEGVVIAFAAGDALSWAVPTEEYVLIVAAGEAGASLDVRDMGSGFAHPVEEVEPNGGFGNAIRFQEGQPRTLRIVEGTGRALLARLDMQRGLPMNGPPHLVTASADLGAGECRAYLYDTARMWEDALVDAAGEGVAFTLYGFDLAARKAGSGALSERLDPDVTLSVVVQACSHGADASRPFLVQGIYPAPGAMERDVTWRLPSVQLPLLTLGIGLALLLLRFR